MKRLGTITPFLPTLAFFILAIILSFFQGEGPTTLTAVHALAALFGAAIGSLIQLALIAWMSRTADTRSANPTRRR